MTRFADHAAERTAHLSNVEQLTDVDFSIEQRITDDAGDVIESYLMVLRDGCVSVQPVGDPANITITQDVETAEGLQAGSLHAQTAFLTGRLRIDGDVNRLLEHRDVIGALLGSGDAGNR